MRKSIYKLLDWRNIEGVIYADIDNPKSVLGPKKVKGGLLIQAFIPDAVSAKVIFKSGEECKLEEVDDCFFAAYLPKKEYELYEISAEYENGGVSRYYDAYQFSHEIPEKQLKKFNSGINYEIYEYLGAHKAVRDGVEGFTFAVWAPMAQRVSVVGDFNLWDGRRHIMERVGDTGVYALFIPEVKEGDLYKYEVQQYAGGNVLKADPYAFYAQKRPDTASVMWDNLDYKWTDDKWMKEREKKKFGKEPMSIYELHLGSWKKPVSEESEDVDQRELFYNYRELAPMIAEYVKDMGYTHIELMPVMEHPFDGSWGYQVTGYYAPTSRYGTPADFMYFMDYMHKEGIGVILDWVPAHFPRDLFGLAKFDGTSLYEHADPRQGSHPHWGTLIYNYGRPEVSNFLIANAMFWVKKYHADGIRMDAVASMLYLDYGKNDGEWVANMYGGKENLEAIEFLKHLNSQFRKQCKGALLIAEESTAWPMITGDVEHDGLGFDYKWNMGWMNDFLSYMKCDPYFRKNNYNQLTFSMIYAYSENFILVFSHDEVVHGKGSMIGKMPGMDEAARFANLRLAYGYMMTHPGKKLLFMGQEFAAYREWSEDRQLDWASLNDDKHANVAAFVKELNKLYASEKALYALDDEVEGFTWINCMSADESIVSFIRESGDKKDTLLVVCNFDTVAYDNRKVGVPFAGKYKEILNSDSEKFGGSGMVNPRVKTSKAEECDGKDNSITFSLPGLSMTVFKYMGEAAPKKPAKSKLADELEKKINKANKEIEEEQMTKIKDVVSKKKVTKERGKK